MMKRFFASGITTLILFTALWFTGVDKIFERSDSQQINIHKYVQTQQRILLNYVDEVDVNVLFKDSVRGMVEVINDSTLVIEGTPADTLFKGINISEIREAGVRFERAYSHLLSAVPDFDPDELFEGALRGMFRSLDPYTDYIDPSQSDRVRESFAGSFQGIGVQFEILNDSITVISAISGGPSDQLGIRSGDRIITIDGESSVGFTQEDVLNTLRGPKGSVVRVGIKRPNMRDVLHFNITRDDIPLYTVDTSYLLDEATGYIKVNRFASTTYEEFMDAMKELNEAGMERLILDLRNNPGGFLDQAVRMASEFFPRGTPLVSTKSRHSRFNSQYNTTTTGRFTDIPLIVLVNEGSASGSEIVAGAVQDNDRGLVVGLRTFGKGLVQQQYELVDNSYIRVTISRYYTPSGRLIQKPYHEGREEYVYEIRNRDRDGSTDVANFISSLPDSLKYTTKSGRVVFGGGGVVPDHIVQSDTTRSYLLGFMRQNNIGNEFVREYLDQNNDAFRAEWEHRFDEFRTDFSWKESVFNTFWNRMDEAGMVLSDTTETATFKDDKMYINPKLVERDRWIPESFTKAELARQIWGTPAYFTVYNDQFDTMLETTMTLWYEVENLKAHVQQNQGSNTASGHRR
jgi:carboxyl-terminal processing protease